MNNTVFSIAYLEYMHEVLNKDIIDSYIPLICECLLKNQSEVVDVEDIKRLMNDIYGISNLTIGAASTILDRMASDKYMILHRSQGRLLVNTSRLNEYHVSLNKDDSIITDFEHLVASISDYSNAFPKHFSREQVSEGLLCFLDTHDIDIVMNHDTKLFESITSHEDKKLAYVIAKYVLESEENGGNALSILNRLAKGNAITNLVSLTGLNNYTGKLDDVIIYIDTPFFYDLLGANSGPNRDAAEELMSILRNNGAHFSMYRHNYNEVWTNLEDVITKLETGIYDLQNSSRLLRMAVSEHYSSIQMKVMLNNVDGILSKWSISISDNPDRPNGYEDIDITELERIITNEYTKNRSRKLFHHELNMLSIDIDSILFTYRLRGNNTARSLKNSKAILLTTNRVIAWASNAPTINTKKHCIPVCTTDMFLSTILWTNYPRDNDQLNRKLLIGECYNTIQLSDSLLEKFYSDIKKKRLSSSITENQYLALTTSSLTLTLLGDKTQNDINAYTDRTASEILEILEHEHKEEIEAIIEDGKKKLNEQMDKNAAEIKSIKDQHQKEVSILLGEKENLKSMISYTESICRADAKKWANFISGCIAIIIAALFLIRGIVPQSYWNSHLVLSRLALLVNSLLTLWAVLNWIGWIPKFANLKEYFFNLLYHRIIKKYMNRNI